jgi:hypothetical protein
MDTDFQLTSEALPLSERAEAVPPAAPSAPEDPKQMTHPMLINVSGRKDVGEDVGY